MHAPNPVVNRIVSFPNGVLITAKEVASSFIEVQVEDRVGHVEYDSVVVGAFSANEKVDYLKRTLM